MTTKNDHIFFYNASTTRLDDRVIKAMKPFLKKHFGNTSILQSFGERPADVI